MPLQGQQGNLARLVAARHGIARMCVERDLGGGGKAHRRRTVDRVTHHDILQIWVGADGSGKDLARRNRRDHRSFTAMSQRLRDAHGAFGAVLTGAGGEPPGRDRDESLVVATGLQQRALLVLDRGSDRTQHRRRDVERLGTAKFEIRDADEQNIGVAKLGRPVAAQGKAEALVPAQPRGRIDCPRRRHRRRAGLRGAHNGSCGVLFHEQNARGGRRGGIGQPHAPRRKVQARNRLERRPAEHCLPAPRRIDIEQPHIPGADAGAHLEGAFAPAQQGRFRLDRKTACHGGVHGICCSFAHGPVRGDRIAGVVEQRAAMVANHPREAGEDCVDGMVQGFGAPLGAFDGLRPHAREPGQVAVQNGSRRRQRTRLGQILRVQNLACRRRQKHRGFVRGPACQTCRFISPAARHRVLHGSGVPAGARVKRLCSPYQNKQTQHRYIACDDARPTLHSSRM